MGDHKVNLIMKHVSIVGHNKHLYGWGGGGGGWGLAALQHNKSIENSVSKKRWDIFLIVRIKWFLLLNLPPCHTII